MEYLLKELNYFYHFLQHDNSNKNYNNRFINKDFKKYEKPVCKKPKYIPQFWNNLDEDIKDYTNCYSYIFDKYEVGADKKLQPGELSIGKFNHYGCDEILDKLNESGWESLTDQEEKYLTQASKKLFSDRPPN